MIRAKVCALAKAVIRAKHCALEKAVIRAKHCALEKAVIRNRAAAALYAANWKNRNFVGIVCNKLV